MLRLFNAAIALALACAMHVSASSLVDTGARRYVEIIDPRAPISDINEYILRMITDDSGAMWIATEHNIYWLTPHDHIYRDSEMQNVFAMHQSRSLFLLGNDILVQSRAGDYLYFDRGHHQFKPIKALSPLSPTLTNAATVAMNDNQFITVATNGAIHLHSLVSENLKPTELYTISVDTCQFSQPESCLKIIHKLMHDTGISDLSFKLVSGMNRAFYAFSGLDERFTARYFDNSGELFNADQSASWIATHQFDTALKVTGIAITQRHTLLTSQSGLLIINDSGSLQILQENNSRLKSNYVISTFKSNENEIWLGTYAGVSVLKLQLYERLSARTCDLSVNNTVGVLPLSDSLLIATLAGLYSVDAEHNACQANLISGLPEEPLGGLIDLGDHALAIGFEANTFIDKSNLAVIHENIGLPLNITGLTRHVSTDRVVLSSMTRGLTEFKDGSWTDFRDIPDSAPAWSPTMIEDHIFFIKDFQLNYFDGTVARPIEQPPAIAQANFQVLAATDSPHEFLAGTLDSQVLKLRWDPQNRSLQIKQSIPLAAQPFSIIADQEGHFWVGLNNGINYISNDFRQTQWLPVSDEFGTPANFNFAAATQLPDGRLGFGSTKGLIIIDPRSALLEEQLALNLTRLRVNGYAGKQPLPWSQLTDVYLPHDTHQFTAEFALMDYVSRERQLYQYRLVGLEDEWTSPSNVPVATYTDLPAGAYTLQVRGASVSDHDREVPIELQIHIATAPWLSWYALIAYAYALIFAAVRLKRFYDTNRLRAEAGELSREMIYAAEQGSQVLALRLDWTQKVLAQRDHYIQALFEHSRQLFGLDSAELDTRQIILPEWLALSERIHELFIDQRNKSTVSLPDLVHFCFERVGRYSRASNTHLTLTCSIENMTIPNAKLAPIAYILVSTLEHYSLSLSEQKVLRAAANVAESAAAGEHLAIDVTLSHPGLEPEILSLNPLIYAGRSIIQTRFSLFNSGYLLRISFPDVPLTTMLDD
jgi:ligand-binding sensor domain-containing protein